MSGPDLGRARFRRGQWVANSVVYGSVVQIAGVTGDVEVNVHNERPLYRVDDYPFKRPVLSVKRARDQPALLLQARYAIIGFTGRTTELARLAAWRDSTEPVSVLLLHGAGGQGKTRLAAQFAQAGKDAGWRVLQARHATDPAPGPGSGTAPLDADLPPGIAGTLVVVDYAERWPTSDLLELCADATRQPHRARVLLIARPAGVWWQTLSGSQLDRLEIDTDQLALGPLADEDTTSPQALFTAARDHFATALGITDAQTLPPPPAFGQDGGFREALSVHMAALATIDAHHRSHKDAAPEPDLGTPAEVSAYLLTRERDHWQHLHAHHRIRIDADALGQSAYTAALTGPQTYPHALDAITRTAPSTTAEPPDRILRDHTIPYPAPTAAPGQAGTTFLEPLYPNRLAEDYLALTLPGHTLTTYTPDPWATGTPQRLLTHVDTATPPAWTRNALTVLIAAAERWPHLTDRQLTPLLTAHPELAVHAGGAALAALANLPGLPPAVLEAVEPHLPKGRHTDLDPGSAALAYRLAHHRLATTQDPLQHARVRDNLALRLSYAGLRDEALTAAQDAMPAWHHLAQANPAAYEPGLASALSNLGAFLSGVGRREEALAPAQEAVTIRRRLAQANPAAYEPDLAMALNNLGTFLSEVGRREEALAPAQEATEVYRRLAQANPAAHEPNLAMALWARAGGQVGGHKDALLSALDAAEESVALYRQLAQVMPSVYGAYLPAVLATEADLLDGLGRTAEATGIRTRLTRDAESAPAGDGG